VNKINVFQNYVYSRSPDIICVTETWLSDKIFDNELLPGAYTIIRKDCTSRGGGVMFAIKSSKSFQVLPTPDLELLTLSIGLTTPTVYCLAYIPPNASAAYHQDFLNYFKSLHSISSNLFVLGDFNTSDINWNSLSGYSPFSSDFCDAIFDLNLHQLIDEPTHIAGNILDVILTNAPENISNLTIDNKPPLSIPSDHFIISFDYLSIPNNNDNSVQRNVYNFSKGNYDGFCDFIYNSDFTSFYLSEDIEFLWSHLSNLINSAFNIFIQPPQFIITTNHPGSIPT